jgi:hypothetical protein
MHHYGEESNQPQWVVREEMFCARVTAIQRPLFLKHRLFWRHLLDSCGASGEAFKSCGLIVHIPQLCLLAYRTSLHSIRDGIECGLNELT